METRPTFEFRNVSEAIRVLRSGKKDDRWYSAAEFLISRATPEVTLMIEVGQALAKRDEESRKSSTRKTIPWRWIASLLAAGTIAIVLGYILGKLFGVSCR